MLPLRSAGRGARLLESVRHRSRSLTAVAAEGPRSTKCCGQESVIVYNRGKSGFGRYSAAWTSHRSSSSSSNDSDTAESQSVRRFAVQVGAFLRIDMSKTGAGVNVTVGNNLEEIVLQPNWLKMDDADLGWNSFEITSSADQVSVKQSETKSPGMQQPELVEMNAQMPEKWCSLDVLAGKGSVFVKNVKEGSLTVQTLGGDVRLGDMKGSAACINSRGGNVEVNVVQAQSSFQTGGGKLTVKRLQGPTIAVDSGGGDVVLGSLYGDDVRVETNGGSVQAKEIQAQEKAVISSCGGSVVIDGIDGKATVESNGGRVEVQLNEHAEEVIIDAGKEGRVVLCLSAKLAATLKYEGPQGVVQEGSILNSGSEIGMYEFNGVGSRQMTKSTWRGSENYLPGGVTACKIHVSSAGEVYVKQRSWLELIKSRVP